MDTVVRPPSGKAGMHVGLVWLQGAEIPTARYKPLADALVAAVPFPLTIAIPEFVGGVPEPLQMHSCVARALQELQLPPNSALFAAGHSLGAVMVQDYVFDHAKDFKGLILMGGALQRKYRNGTRSHLFPLPHLVLDGMLDGLYRATRQAESLYFALPRPATAVQREHAARSQAVIVYGKLDYTSACSRRCQTMFS